MSNIISIKFDFIKNNRWSAIDAHFDAYALFLQQNTIKSRLCDSINKWLSNQNCPFNKNNGYTYDASNLLAQAIYLICDVDASKLEWVWSNDAKNPISKDDTAQQVHKCHCDRWLVFNQGCKCGGI
jgi:hypothetical protein